MTTPQSTYVDPVPIAFQSVNAGMSGRAGLIAARAAGVRIRDATWFRIYGEARNAVALQIQEASAVLNEIPKASSIAVRTTKNATGHIQYVEVYVRDRDTGIVGRRPYAIRVQDLITREDAVKQALGTFAVATGPEGSYASETVLGAAYTATYRMVPREP